MKQGLSQEALAEKAGCSVDTVKRYEKGTAGMRLDTAWYFALALGIPFESFLPERENNAEDQLRRKAEELIRLIRGME